MSIGNIFVDKNGPSTASGRRLARSSRFVDTVRRDSLDNTVFAGSAAVPVFQPIPWVADDDIPEGLNLDIEDPATPRGHATENSKNDDVPDLRLDNPEPWRRTAAFRVQRIIAEVGFPLLNLN